MKKKISVVILMVIICILVGVVCISPKKNKTESIIAADTTEVQKTEHIESTESNVAENVEIGFEFEDVPEVQMGDSKTNNSKKQENNQTASDAEGMDPTDANQNTNSESENADVSQEIPSTKPENDGKVSVDDEGYQEKDPNSLGDDEF